MSQLPIARQRRDITYNNRMKCYNRLNPTRLTPLIQIKSYLFAQATFAAKYSLGATIDLLLYINGDMSCSMDTSPYFSSTERGLERGFGTPLGADITSSNIGNSSGLLPSQTSIKLLPLQVPLTN